MYHVMIYLPHNIRLYKFAQYFQLLISTRLFRLARVDYVYTFAYTCRGQWSGNETTRSHDCVKPPLHSD